MSSALDDGHVKISVELLGLVVFVVLSKVVSGLGQGLLHPKIVVRSDKMKRIQDV